MMAENEMQDSVKEVNDVNLEGEPITETVIEVNDVESRKPVQENVIEDKIDTDALQDEIIIDPAIVDKLTHGTLALFLPNLQKAKGSLNEVLHNQEVLIETIQQENAKFMDSVATKQLTETMIKARQYHTKLVNLKKEMASLVERSTKLKRRAVKIQQQKQKDELQRAAQRERELEKERMLTAKVVKPDKGAKTDKEPS